MTSSGAATASSPAAATPAAHAPAAIMKRDDGSASSQSLLAMQPASSQRCSPAVSILSMMHPSSAATAQSRTQASTQDAQDGAHNRSLATPGAGMRAQFEQDPTSTDLCRPSAAHPSLGTAPFASSDGMPSTPACDSGSVDYSVFDKVSPGVGKMLAESQAACIALLSQSSKWRMELRGGYKGVVRAAGCNEGSGTA